MSGWWPWHGQALLGAVLAFGGFWAAYVVSPPLAYMAGGAMMVALLAALAVALIKEMSKSPDEGGDKNG